MKPGDYIIFPTADRVAYVWRITGVYYGAVGQESVVGLESVIFSSAWAGHEVKEMLVPWALVCDHVYASPKQRTALKGQP